MRAHLAHVENRSCQRVARVSIYMGKLTHQVRMTCTPQNNLQHSSYVVHNNLSFGLQYEGDSYGGSFARAWADGERLLRISLLVRSLCSLPGPYRKKMTDRLSEGRAAIIFISSSQGYDSAY